LHLGGGQCGGQAARIARTAFIARVIAASIREKYLSGRQAQDFPCTRYDRELADHLLGRPEIARRGAVPWLDSVGALQDKLILEIGCGTGSSTVALAEQGAIVTAIDTDEASLAVAKTRCEVYGLNPSIHTLNATEILRVFGVGVFDLVIFYASLEPRSQFGYRRHFVPRRGETPKDSLFIPRPLRLVRCPVRSRPSQSVYCW
jgi:2-polyprenyl-3-methyl-5-hydroxy-6-metoxy-1,4-benzoquinol methylase